MLATENHHQGLGNHYKLVFRDVLFREEPSTFAWRWPDLNLRRYKVELDIFWIHVLLLWCEITLFHCVSYNMSMNYYHFWNEVVNVCL